MRRTMDAFIQAVEDARRRLIRTEGQNVSMREVLRRAGYSDSSRAGAAYHLNRSKSWPKGHKVPPEIVKRLSEVLPISHEELARAAQAAAGYNVVTSRPDMQAVARFLDSDNVSEEDKVEVVASMAQMIADEMGRRRVTNP